MTRPLVFFLLLLISLRPFTLEAKNLSGRYGFGVSVQNLLNQSLPGLSLRFHPSPEVGVSFIGAFDTADTTKRTSIGAKIHRNAYREENMNVYVGIGAFLLSLRNTSSATASTDSGFEIDGILGGEFFLAGLPNLGLQFETGVGVRSAGDVTFSTIGATFAGAGIHYYF